MLRPPLFSLPVFAISCIINRGGGEDGEICNVFQRTKRIDFDYFANRFLLGK